MPLKFSGSSKPTLGVETELQILDSENFVLFTLKMYKAEGCEQIRDEIYRLIESSLRNFQANFSPNSAALQDAL